MYYSPKALKETRLNRHLSQEELANMAGVSIRAIQKYESGKGITIEVAGKLGKVLGVEFIAPHPKNEETPN